MAPRTDFGVAQVADGVIEIEIGKMRARALRPHQGAHGKAALDELAGDGRADEAAGAGHQYLVRLAHGFNVQTGMVRSRVPMASSTRA